MMQYDVREITKRLLKYLISGIAIMVSSYLVSSKKLVIKEIMAVGLTAASVFLILDTFAPSIYDSSQLGAGFAIGSKLVGGL